MDVPPDLAATAEEADRRHDLTVDEDPFPDIAPALLNGSDIYDYVRATGLILPFDEHRIKAASYEVSIGSTYIYWDGNGDKRTLGEDDIFTLAPNSIAFVATMEEFRLPSYIAVRFNLRINNVHRGLLLGTGPLVDPGFVGRLLVPLHNLTTNTYTFEPGEKFAWFEFTKISPNERWFSEHRVVREKYGLRGQYNAFPKNKKERSPSIYFKEALKGTGSSTIRSSIPEAIVQATISAEAAQGNARKAENAVLTTRNIVAGLGFIAGAAVILAAAQVIMASFHLVKEVEGSISSLSAVHSSLAARVERALPALERGLSEVSEETAELRNAMANLDRALEGTGDISIEMQLEQLRGSVSDVQAEVDGLRRVLERPEE